ncbi:hypothetical protein E1A91_A05G312300v1 [Gossypium mustelinum]|uniref:Uncharacterized protein n=1 Tax=Gossypium mustelinum TaxID=34275 RepID=A0A5D2ZEB6_GOSMU|nr:hypothetical protein E1A91_A05G312300v1 [Gossypium mustelinum]
MRLHLRRDSWPGSRQTGCFKIPLLIDLKAEPSSRKKNREEKTLTYLWSDIRAGERTSDNRNPRYGVCAGIRRGHTEAHVVVVWR